MRRNDFQNESEVHSYSDCEDFISKMTSWTLQEFEEFFPKALIEEVNRVFMLELNTGCG